MTAWARLREFVPDALRPYLPTVQERGEYTGFLSTFAEFHAIGVGFALGPEHVDLVAAYGLGTAGGKAKRSGHLTDAYREMAYTGLGVALRILAPV